MAEAMKASPSFRVEALVRLHRQGTGFPIGNNVFHPCRICLLLPERRQRQSITRHTHLVCRKKGFQILRDPFTNWVLAFSQRLISASRQYGRRFIARLSESFGPATPSVYPRASTSCEFPHRWSVFQKVDLDLREVVCHNFCTKKIFCRCCLNNCLPCVLIW